MVAHRLSRRASLGVLASTKAAICAPSLRLLVVTGGHEFDTSFWDIFKSQTGWELERRVHERGTTATAYDNPIAHEVEAVRPRLASQLVGARGRLQRSPRPTKAAATAFDRRLPENRRIEHVKSGQQP